MSHHKAKIAMKQAWRIAREGATLYGGSVRRYLDEALRLAWAELRADPVMREVDRIVSGIWVRRAAGAVGTSWGRPYTYHGGYVYHGAGR